MVVVLGVAVAGYHAVQPLPLRTLPCVGSFGGMWLVQKLFLCAAVKDMFFLQFESCFSCWCTLTNNYTRSPLEDSRLFGPSPWKILRHYL